MVKIFWRVWEKNNSGFYYQKYSEPTDELLADINEQPKLMFHKLGTSQDEDELIYENPEQPRWGWSISISENNAHKFFLSVTGQKKKIESILNLMILKISFQSSMS